MKRFLLVCLPLLTARAACHGPVIGPGPKAAVVAAVTSAPLDSICTRSCSIALIDRFIRQAPFLPASLGRLPIVDSLEVGPIPGPDALRRVVWSMPLGRELGSDTAFVSAVWIESGRTNSNDGRVVLLVRRPGDYGLLVDVVLRFTGRRWQILRMNFGES